MNILQPTHSVSVRKSKSIFIILLFFTLSIKLGTLLISRDSTRILSL